MCKAARAVLVGRHDREPVRVQVGERVHRRRGRERGQAVQEGARREVGVAAALGGKRQPLGSMGMATRGRTVSTIPSRAIVSAKLELTRARKDAWTGETLRLRVELGRQDLLLNNDNPLRRVHHDCVAGAKRRDECTLIGSARCSECSCPSCLSFGTSI